MGKTRAPYPLEFKRQMVELVRAGRTPKELSREFEPTAQSVEKRNVRCLRRRSTKLRNSINTWPNVTILPRSEELLPRESTGNL
jgi:transposase-like protein